MESTWRDYTEGSRQAPEHYAQDLREYGTISQFLTSTILLKIGSLPIIRRAHVLAGGAHVGEGVKRGISRS